MKLIYKNVCGQTWLWKTDVSDHGDDGESFVSGNTSDFSDVTQGSNHSSFLESTSGDSFNLSLASLSTGLTPSSLGSGSEAASAASSDVGRYAHYNKDSK